MYGAKYGNFLFTFFNNLLEKKPPVNTMMHERVLLQRTPAYYEFSHCS